MLSRFLSNGLATRMLAPNLRRSANQTIVRTSDHSPTPMKWIVGRNIVRCALRIVTAFLFLVCSTLVVPEPAQGEDVSANSTVDQKSEQFRAEVLPILQKRCLECHSHATGKSKGGLMLDSRSGWEKGGDSGTAIVPGKPDESLLIQAIRHQELRMPPTGKLPEEEIEVLVKWVALGATDPRVLNTSASSPSDGVATRSKDSRASHWSFQPRRLSALPAIQKADWPRGAIDQYVLARMEASQLTPSKPADRNVWLRRVSFDLTGLPPTSSELDEYLADVSGQAEETVVDRLLASPAFGERWGRHWLDLVGYADQIGTSNNVFAEHAWRYRDHVIASLNRDQPFDEFLRVQIAGDLLPAATVEQRADQIVGTGFLVLGDLSIVEADKAKLRIDVVDHQLDKIGKAMLGMTIACARCHDHKFDPISQHDYYSLAGILYSTQSVERAVWGVWSFPVVRELPESPAARDARLVQLQQHREQLDKYRKEQQEARRQIARIDAQLVSEKSTLTEMQTADLTREKTQFQGRIGYLDALTVHARFFAPKPPLAFAVREEPDLRDMRVTIRGNPHAFGEVVPRGFPEILSGVAPKEASTLTADNEHGSESTGQTQQLQRCVPSPAIPSYHSGRVELARWITDARHPLTARVAVNRMWQKLFGEGLVRSVDYFGVRGESPSHPELLDWLAQRFVDLGWSRKKLLREMVLSQTYGQSSASQPANETIDPDNRLLWRMNRRRLDAEALRDALLVVSGRLMSQPGGPGLPLEILENTGGLRVGEVNPPHFNLGRFRPEQEFVRTVYLPIIRSGPQMGPAELRNMFDFTQPGEFAGARSVTTVPTQALFLMNSPMLRSRSRDLAQRIRIAATTEQERLAHLWKLVLNRTPRDDERSESIQFLNEVRADWLKSFPLAAGADEKPYHAEQDLQAWTELCHALLASNEFLMLL